MGAEERSAEEESQEESILLERMALYPGLYESMDKLKDDLISNGVEWFKRDTPLKLSNDDRNEIEDPAPENENIIASLVATPQQNTRQLDIWGRLPPKEPETMIDCPLCKRLFSTLRFAPHRGEQRRNRRG